MFCSKCGHSNDDAAKFCAKCGASISTAASMPSGTSVQETTFNAVKPVFSPDESNTVSQGVMPDGVKGWSWGAFLLNWIWAIGNRTWLGIFAIIPYVGILVAIWLGIKGREMAWKNKDWDSLEHFNRVQKKWSQWAVGLTLASVGIGILAAVTIPAYHNYVKRSQEAALSVNLSTTGPEETNNAKLSPATVPLQAATTPNAAVDLSGAGLNFPLNTPFGNLVKSDLPDSKSTISINQQVLFSGDDAHWQHPVHVFKMPNQREFVLMGSTGGRGNSCETLYYFLVIDASGIKHTPEFGTCAPQGTATEQDGKITFQIARMGGYSTVVFDGNLVTEDGVVVQLIDSNDPSK